MFNTLNHDSTLWLAFLGGMAGFAATALGALPALGLSKISKKTEALCLGFAAGMMLAASVFSLIIPGIDAGSKLTGSELGGVGIVVFGIFLGILMMLLLDRWVPHEHFERGRFGVSPERYRRIWLFALAVAIHNFPEGMAIGMGFLTGDTSVGTPVTIAISLQDIPEGLALALALVPIVRSKWVAVAWSIASGLMEPLGALLVAALFGGLHAVFPIGLGLSAGAMIFVVIHEVLPEFHSEGNETPATISAMFGFCLMMVLDVALA